MEYKTDVGERRASFDVANPDKVWNSSTQQWEEPSGGGGGVDQTARDMAAAAQATADSKENFLGNFAPEVPISRKYLSAIFNQNNPPTYRDTSWELLPAFLDNAAQVTPASAYQSNFNAWIGAQRAPTDPGGVKIGKFETTAATNKPALFDGYTKFYTILFHTSQYGSGRDVYQRGSGWVFAYNDNGFGPWAFINYDMNGFQITYKKTSIDSDYRELSGTWARNTSDHYEATLTLTNPIPIRNGIRLFIKDGFIVDWDSASTFDTLIKEVLITDQGWRFVQIGQPWDNYPVVWMNIRAHIVNSMIDSFIIEIEHENVSINFEPPIIQSGARPWMYQYV